MLSKPQCFRLIRYIFVLICLNVALSLTHELVHEAIYESYKYEDIKVGVFRSEGTPTPQTDLVEARRMHNWNEIIGYYFIIGMNILVGHWMIKKEEH